VISWRDCLRESRSNSAAVLSESLQIVPKRKKKRYREGCLSLRKKGTSYFDQGKLRPVGLELFVVSAELNTKLIGSRNPLPSKFADQNGHLRMRRFFWSQTSYLGKDLIGKADRVPFKVGSQLSLLGFERF
jgi:hypothetical protein